MQLKTSSQYSTLILISYIISFVLNFLAVNFNFRAEGKFKPDALTFQEVRAKINSAAR